MLRVGHDPGVLFRVLAQRLHGGVAVVVVHDEDLARQRDAGEDPVEAADDRVALVVHRDDDRHPRRLGFDHTCTPPSRRFQMSTTGTDTLELAVHRVRRTDHEQVGVAQDGVEVDQVGIVRDVRIVGEHRAAP